MSNPAPIIFHDIGSGLRRLLSAPQDLPDAVQWREPGPLIGVAEPKYRKLFDAYINELTWAVGIAVPWWNSLVRNSMEHGQTENDAIRANYELRPAGPASCPEVVGVIRSHWLACDRLNQENAVDLRVPPEVLSLGWLRMPDHEDLISVLTAMPYWPIGFDEDRNFI